MRIRIIRPLPVREVDGVAVDNFEVGCEYEIGSRLGALFLAERWAEPAVAVRAQASPAKPGTAEDRTRKGRRQRR
jgi:hypothetical protein